MSGVQETCSGVSYRVWFDADMPILDEIAASRSSMRLLTVSTVVIAVLLAGACLVVGPTVLRVLGVLFAAALVGTLVYVNVATRRLRQ